MARILEIEDIDLVIKRNSTLSPRYRQRKLASWKDDSSYQKEVPAQVRYNLLAQAILPNLDSKFTLESDDSPRAIFSVAASNLLIGLRDVAPAYRAESVDLSEIVSMHRRVQLWSSRRSGHEASPDQQLKSLQLRDLQRVKHASTSSAALKVSKLLKEAGSIAIDDLIAECDSNSAVIGTAILYMAGKIGLGRRHLFWLSSNQGSVKEPDL